jgi:hypothetical protein
MHELNWGFDHILVDSSLRVLLIKRVVEAGLEPLYLGLVATGFDQLDLLS